MEINGKIKVLLTDSHKVMRDGLRALFNSQPNISVVGEADNPDMLSELVENLSPDIVTLGVNIGGEPVLQTVRELVSKLPKTKIVAHSVYAEREFICEMLKSGVFAYVHKQQDFSELLRAIEAVAHNEIYLCPIASDIVMKNYIKDLSSLDYSATLSLTDRERGILTLISEGRSSKQIASSLHISTKTVDTHRRQIMNKLKLFSIPELTKYAIRCGLTSLN